MSPIENAIKKAGGIVAFASALGVSTGRASNWPSRGIPAEYGPATEKLTGIRVERLCPDLSWVRAKGHTRPLLDVGAKVKAKI